MHAQLVILVFLSWCAHFSRLQQVASDQYRYYNIGVLMASHLDSPFDLERCGPAIDMALEQINDRFLAHHGIRLKKVQER
ncbi:hypothetical protein Zmor_019965 [Zophobas morio]|uniref:Receptor ligand binding region domain-containing protein n=1 Tax=Zophobas morio TaxID=2755281 RepID=A0AA38M9W9_9CUCU|nr:hypothetical protein Zmor_019965 [Zophobas morio]